MAARTRCRFTFPYLARGKYNSRAVAPKDPGELFVWRTPFEPIVRLTPRSRQSRRPLERTRQEQAIFLGFNLLGDFLCTTPVVRSYRRANPESFITYIVHNAGYSRLLEGNPDIDLVLYNDDLYLHGEQVLSEEWLRRLPLQLDEPCNLYRFNVHEVCRADPRVFEDHISWGYARYLGIPIQSVRPVVSLTDDDRALARSLVREPYVVFGMHTTSKVLGSDGETTVKDWIFDRWVRLAQWIKSRGDFDVFAVGSEWDARFETRSFRSLYGLPIKVVAALLEQAACVVTVEGGLSHLGHAVDAPMVVIFSKYVRYEWAFPREATRCRVLYEDPRLISWEDVASEARLVLSWRL